MVYVSTSSKNTTFLYTQVNKASISTADEAYRTDDQSSSLKYSSTEVNRILIPSCSHVNLPLKKGIEACLPARVF
jgi:hypothetical protein